MISNATTPAAARARSAAAPFLVLILAGWMFLAQGLSAAMAQDAEPGAVTTPPSTATPATADGEAGPDDAPHAVEAMTRSPLAPAPTSSPRQTFRSFRALAGGATTSLMEAFRQPAEDGTLFDSEEARRKKEEALQLLVRAASTLDLSAVAPANRRTVALSAILQLEEILKRIDVPDLDTIPGTAEVEAGSAANGWTLPGTEIRMARVEAPSGEQQYLFSTDTVARLPTYYALVQDTPHSGAYDIDFYQHFVSAPGLSMPIELYRYVLQFPSWLLAIHAEQAVWQWIALVGLTALMAGVLLLVLRLEAWIPQPSGALRSAVRRLVSPALVLLLLAAYDWLADNVINLTGPILADLELIVTSFQVVTVAVITLFSANVLAALIISSPRIRSESLDASLIRLVLRVVGFLAAGFILFHGATRIGLPAYGIVAGLGVGGLAIALAVRPTLENFIGGIILYADRPVKVGDFCKFGDMLGTVEEIGLRSTKVRGLDRTLVTVQNAEFAQMSITNYTRRDANLMSTTIRLRYETDPSELSAIIDNIAAMLRADERVDADTVRVCFRGFGEFSLDVEIWCYLRIADWGRFLKAQEALFMKVMQIVEAGGSTFAVPAQITYFSADKLADVRQGDTRPELAVTLTDARPA